METVQSVLLTTVLRKKKETFFLPSTVRVLKRHLKHCIPGIPCMCVCVCERERESVCVYIYVYMCMYTVARVE